MGTQRWKVAVANSWCAAIGLGMGGAIGLGIPPTVAQLRPIEDTTPQGNLGTIVAPLSPIVDIIGGGTIPQNGANLFHSFSQFNIDVGRGAYFLNPDGVRNILSRVTGNRFSDIRGTIGVLGTANLFLINPNGILFGQTAALDMQGSFVATTANAIRLGDTGFFSASQPETSNLLTVDPSAFFFNSLQPQPIISLATLGLAFTTNQFTQGLQVANGRSLLLVGGDVGVGGGGLLQAPGGRVDIGSVAGSGSVGLIFDGNQLKLSFPTDIARADVLITNQAKVFVSGGGGGDVAVYGQNISLTNGSSIKSGIAQNFGSPTSRSGEITIDAIGAIKLSDSSSIENSVRGVGNSGNIQISGQTVDLVNASTIASFSVGQGNAGNVTVQAKDTISLSGKDQSGTVSGILGVVASLQGFMDVRNGGDILLQARTVLLGDGAQIKTNNLSSKGNAGNIRVEAADSLVAADGSGLQTTTAGQGNAGNVIINAQSRVSFTGPSANGQAVSGIASTVEVNAVGDGGNIEISAGSLDVTHGARLIAASAGSGDSGNVIINARDRVSFNSSLISTTVFPDAIGNGGNVEIAAGSLEVVNGAKLLAGTFGRGNSGNVIVNARDHVSFNSGVAYRHWSVKE